ncbi:hypothetical protein G5I_02463 [Acromyrmex echinatior]|uniref:Uncharacterized protein n=1 Tax=Acromyrmex echinatior TaxID=103372 RepID=F4WAC7_ACREC|nr:hypothetical protein G5I_02463 [Acromyrmex echinatior]
MLGLSLLREEHKSGINSVRRKSGDFKKSLYTPVRPSAKKYRSKEDKKKRRPPPPPPPPPVSHNICHAIRVLHTRYIPFGREERKREGEGEREVKDEDENTEGSGTKGPPGKKKEKKKDEADRKSSGNEALSFSSGASPISLTSADLPAYYPACVRECVHVYVYVKVCGMADDLPILHNRRLEHIQSLTRRESLRLRSDTIREVRPYTRCIEKCLREKDEENSNKCPLMEARDHLLLRLPPNIFVETNRDRKGEIALLSTVNAREQAAAPGTVIYNTEY